MSSARASEVETIVPLSSQINSNNYSNFFGVLTAFSLSILLISVPVRVYVRAKCKRWGIDDLAYAGAVVCFRIWLEYCLSWESLLTRSVGRLSPYFNHLLYSLGSTKDWENQTHCSLRRTKRHD